MFTGQRYGEGADSASSVPPAAPSAAQPTLTPDEQAITIPLDTQLGRSLLDPLFVNALRQDVRAWFLAYIRKELEGEYNYNPNSEAESIGHYDLMDDFLSSLINAGIKQMEGREHE